MTELCMSLADKISGISEIIYISREITRIYILERKHIFPGVLS